MELFVQYLDDLEDLWCAFLLLLERVRRGLQMSLVLATSFALQFLAILLALSHPPLALAVVCLTVVGLLYKSATGGRPGVAA